MRLHQIAPNHPIDNKPNFVGLIVTAFSFVFVLILIQFIYPTSNVVIILLELIFIAILMIRSRYLWDDWVTKAHHIDMLEFDISRELIKFGEKSIGFDEISNVDFRYNHYRGKRFGGVIHNGVSEIRITQNGDHQTKLKFVIESKAQYEYLKSIFERLYQLRIPIIEEFGNHKYHTLCLEIMGNKTYDEISRRKKELGL